MPRDMEPKEYARLYFLRQQDKAVLQKLADCFCRQCVVCTVLRPIYASMTIPPEFPEGEPV